MHLLHGLYERDLRALPTGCPVPLGCVWRKAIGGADRERAFAAAEVATLLDQRRALRNGTVWIEHSLAFRSRETLFIPQRQWEESRRAHYRRLGVTSRKGPLRTLRAAAIECSPSPAGPQSCYFGKAFFYFFVRGPRWKILRSREPRILPPHRMHRIVAHGNRERFPAAFPQRPRPCRRADKLPDVAR